MADPTQAQYVAAFQAAKEGVAEMIASMDLGWEQGLVEGYITDERINTLSDKVAMAVVNAVIEPK